MLGKIIAITHLISVIIVSIYGFIFPKNFIYDYLYFVILFVIQLHWGFLKGECVFSYIYKYTHYENYKCGDTTDLDDFNELGGTGKKNDDENTIDYKQLFVSALDVLYIMSIIIVNNRSNLSNIYFTLFVLVFLRYFYVYFNEAIGINTKQKLTKMLGNKIYKILQSIYYEYHIVKIHNEVNMMISIILVLFLFYITYRNRKKLIA